MINDLKIEACPTSTLRISVEDMVSLGVRTRGHNKPELPKDLFQSLPEEAMSLIATIPGGTFAVSIPADRASNLVCPILRAVSPSIDGFVIVYSRKPNGRYEATAVRYRGKAFSFDEFVPLARQWTEERAGRLEAIPGRYGYFAPGIEEWGVILRDNGYAARDPSCMPAAASLDLLPNRRLHDNGGIQARIPVFTGEKFSHEAILPAFARVEVAFGQDPKRQGGWISYVEYQRIRKDQARMPETIVPDFHEWLRRLAEESGFRCWIFRCGMLFGDHTEWWGDNCRRRTEHEGLDFAMGLLPGGEVGCVPEGTPVSSLAEGEVIAVLDDFIASTVVVRHPTLFLPNGKVFHTLISHIRPVSRNLDPVARGQVIGTIGRSTSGSAPSHLHLTGAWLPENLSSGEIRMAHIHPAFVPVTLVDFTDELQKSPFCSLPSS